MYLIRQAMNKRRLVTEKLHEDYRKIYKSHQFAYQYLMEFFKELWVNQTNVVIGVCVATAVLLGIYIFLLDITK